MYNEYKILYTRKESKDIRSVFFDRTIEAQPGQFIMVWLPGIDEKPFSLSHEDGFTYKEVGPFTKELSKLKRGDMLSIRGPFGRGFPKRRKELTAIAGGMGGAPLKKLLDMAVWSTDTPKITILYGGRTKSDILFKKELRHRGELRIATEDGSLGHKGLVTDLIEPDKKQMYAVCGPERMLKAVAEKIYNKTKKAEDIYICIERYMKCGEGICGTCSCDGYRVCRDGPVFSYAELLDNRHFGIKKREKSGKLVPI
jgi:dihydroorotate dehydrogenase electron transfer subunit